MASTLDSVRTVVVQSLALEQDPQTLTAETPLFGALPELDSLGVLALVSSLEERFDITIEDDEFGADLFDTVGSLTEFVEGKLG